MVEWLFIKTHEHQHLLAFLQAPHLELARCLWFLQQSPITFAAMFLYVKVELNVCKVRFDRGKLTPASLLV